MLCPMHFCDLQRFGFPVGKGHSAFHSDHPNCLNLLWKYLPALSFQLLRNRMKFSNLWMQKEWKRQEMPQLLFLISLSLFYLFCFSWFLISFWISFDSFLLIYCQPVSCLKIRNDSRSHLLDRLSYMLHIGYIPGDPVCLLHLHPFCRNDYIFDS